jgi:anti-sigma28 factor (negative regulator of flagellin synthesis)
MKKLIPTIAFIICSIWIVSCGNSQINADKEAKINPVEKSKAESSNPNPTPTNTQSSSTSVNKIATVNQVEAEETQKAIIEQPRIGTVKQIVNGDLMCYVTLVDENGTEHNVGASFDICAEQATFLNKKVRAFYKLESVNDCQSAEPCGKTRKESLITKMEILKPN